MNELMAWLAQGPPPPVQGPEFGGSSPIGLLVVLLMGIAVVFLIRSMNKHLRKVPPSFNDTGNTGGPESRDGADDPGKADSGTGATGVDAKS